MSRHRKFKAKLLLGAATIAPMVEFADTVLPVIVERVLSWHPTPIEMVWAPHGSEAEHSSAPAREVTAVIAASGVASGLIGGGFTYIRSS
jgi:hypothetical protein